MSQPNLQLQLPPPAESNEVKEEVPAQSSTNPEPPQLQASQPEHTQEPPPKINTCIPEQSMYKNRLQEYTQKSSIALPVYKTVNEGGFQHIPMFRSTVFVDGVYYTSSLTFSSRKAAEQDVAKIALDGISDKIKREGCSLIHEETIFCKSALCEYAVKMNLQKPTYTTTQVEGMFPVFVSSLVFDGTPYTGPAGKNKKEAEQLVARIVIQSILDNSDSRTVMSEILKSKTRLFNALNKAKDQHGMQIGSVPGASNLGGTWHSGMPGAVNVGSSSGVPPAEAIPVSGPGLQTCYSGPAVHHEFKKRKAESSLENDNTAPIVTPPIAFVPPAMEQSSLAPCSTTGKKKNRKNKKKAKKEAEPDNQIELAPIPLCELPPCSVAQ